MCDYESEPDFDDYGSDVEEPPVDRPDLQDAFVELVETQRPSLLERPFFLLKMIARAETRSFVLMTGFPIPEWILNRWFSEKKFKNFADEQEYERANHCAPMQVDPLDELLDLIGTLGANPLCRPFKVSRVLTTGIGGEGEESMVYLEGFPKYRIQILTEWLTVEEIVSAGSARPAALVPAITSPAFP